MRRKSERVWDHEPHERLEQLDMVGRNSPQCQTNKQLGDNESTWP